MSNSFIQMLFTDVIVSCVPSRRQAWGYSDEARTRPCPLEAILVGRQRTSEHSQDNVRVASATEGITCGDLGRSEKASPLQVMCELPRRSRLGKNLVENILGRGNRQSP